MANLLLVASYLLGAFSFSILVVRLIAHKDPAAALDAFERMEAETRALIDHPAHGALSRDFFRVAQEHVRLAASRLGGT